MKIHSYLLNYMFPLEWWKTELKDHPQDHLGPASIMATTIIVMTVVWGKYKAFGFFITAVIAYPLSHRHIRYFMFLEAYETGLAAACASMPFIDTQVPTLSIPLHLALGYAILTRAWKMSHLSHQQSQKIDELEESTIQLKKNVRTLEKNAADLMQALMKLLNEVQLTQELQQTKIAINQQENETKIKIEVDYGELNKKLFSLLQLCQKAADVSSIKKQLTEINKNEQKIAALTAECESKQKEITIFIEDLKTTLQRFKTVLEGATSEKIDATEKLKLINNYLEAIINRKV